MYSYSIFKTLHFVYPTVHPTVHPAIFKVLELFCIDHGFTSVILMANFLILSLI